jgi:hypothetical protein
LSRGDDVKTCVLQPNGNVRIIASGLGWVRWQRDVYGASVAGGIANKGCITNFARDLVEHNSGTLLGIRIALRRTGDVEALDKRNRDDHE